MWSDKPIEGIDAPTLRDGSLVGLMAQELGVEPSRVNYVAFSGGGEALRHGETRPGWRGAGHSGDGVVRRGDDLHRGHHLLVLVIANLALEFRSADYFALMLLALLSVAGSITWDEGADWPDPPERPEPIG